MNIKMAINSQVSTTESKNKANKQNRNNHRYGDYLEGYHLGEGEWGKVAGIKKLNW